MILGAFLSIVLFVSVQVVSVLKIINDPVSQREPSVRSPDLMFMDSEESDIWFSLRRKMKEGDYADANELIHLEKEKIELSINLPKGEFKEDEAVLVSLSLTNKSEQRIIVCEPQRRLKDLHLRKLDERFFGEFVLQFSPRKARWVKILDPSESLKLPFIFDSGFIGPHEIETTVSFSKLSEDLSTDRLEEGQFYLTYNCFFNITDN